MGSAGGSLPPVRGARGGTGGLQVLWRDVNSAMGSAAVSQSLPKPAQRGESLVSLVNGKLAPNFTQLGEVTLRPALSPLSAVPGRCPVLTSGQAEARSSDGDRALLFWQAQQSPAAPTHKQDFHGRDGSRSRERASLLRWGHERGSGCLLPALQSFLLRTPRAAKRRGPSPCSAIPFCGVPGSSRGTGSPGVGPSGDWDLLPRRGPGMLRARSAASQTLQLPPQKRPREPIPRCSAADTRSGRGGVCAQPWLSQKGKILSR